MLVHDVSDYVLQAIVNPDGNQATLLSPVYDINTTVCLTFQYNISSQNMALFVVVSSYASPEFQFFNPNKYISYFDQTLTSWWSSASVELPDGLKQIQFTAYKVDYVDAKCGSLLKLSHLGIILF